MSRSLRYLPLAAEFIHCAYEQFWKEEEEEEEGFLWRRRLLRGMIHTRGHMRTDTHAQMLIHTGVHTILCTRTCMHTHTHSYTPTNHDTSQIFTNVHTDARACARAHTHTLKRTHTHHAYGYALGATAVHTLFSSYAHTIILLC